MTSWLEDAQEKQGLSYEDCASAIGCSRATFIDRVKRPGTLRLNELHSLDSLLEGDSLIIAREALKEAMPNFFSK